jgi:hypothetical protein
MRDADEARWLERRAQIDADTHAAHAVHAAHTAREEPEPLG